mmetsp:Transcript_41/g.81  ORF Transcript_41/g.81 Transcript_41/m.81 type:complete len:152 (+) Transcript_41:3-458(+)
MSQLAYLDQQNPQMGSGRNAAAPGAKDSVNISRLQNLTNEISSQISGSAKENQSFINQQPQSKEMQSMHYEVPSLSSMLYEFTNKEQESILQAFRIGNWVGLRDLPDNIAPNNVLQQFQLKVKQAMHDSTINANNRQKHLEMLKGSGGDYF